MGEGADAAPLVAWDHGAWPRRHRRRCRRLPHRRPGRPAQHPPRGGWRSGGRGPAAAVRARWRGCAAGIHHRRFQRSRRVPRQRGPGHQLSAPRGAAALLGGADVRHEPEHRGLLAAHHPGAHGLRRGRPTRAGPGDDHPVRAGRQAGAPRLERRRVPAAVRPGGQLRRRRQLGRVIGAQRPRGARGAPGRARHPARHGRRDQLLRRGPPDVAGARRPAAAHLRGPYRRHPRHDGLDPSARGPRGIRGRCLRVRPDPGRDGPCLRPDGDLAPTPSGVLASRTPPRRTSCHPPSRATSAWSPSRARMARPSPPPSTRGSRSRSSSTPRAACAPSWATPRASRPPRRSSRSSFARSCRRVPLWRFACSVPGPGRASPSSRCRSDHSMPRRWPRPSRRSGRPRPSRHRSPRRSSRSRTTSRVSPGHASWSWSATARRAAAATPKRRSGRCVTQGFDVTVNVVGLGLSKQDRRRIRRLATLGGGSYFDAQGAGQLEDAIGAAVSAPFEVRDATGTVVARGIVNGPALELPPGTYRVTVLTDPPHEFQEVVLGSADSATLTLPAAP